jgi:hypothetical protein
MFRRSHDRHELPSRRSINLPSGVDGRTAMERSPYRGFASRDIARGMRDRQGLSGRMLLNSAVSFLVGAGQRSGRDSRGAPDCASSGDAAKHNPTFLTTPFPGVVLWSILLNAYRSSFYHPIGTRRVFRLFVPVNVNFRTFRKKILERDSDATSGSGGVAPGIGRCAPVRGHRRHGADRGHQIATLQAFITYIYLNIVRLQTPGRGGASGVGRVAPPREEAGTSVRPAILPYRSGARPRETRPKDMVITRAHRTSPGVPHQDAPGLHSQPPRICTPLDPAVFGAAGAGPHGLVNRISSI